MLILVLEKLRSIFIFCSAVQQPKHGINSTNKDIEYETPQFCYTSRHLYSEKEINLQLFFTIIRGLVH